MLPLYKDKDDKPKVPSHNPSMFIILWDLKEPAHLSQRIGHVVPGVVVSLLWCIMVGMVVKGDLCPIVDSTMYVFILTQ